MLKRFIQTAKARRVRARAIAYANFLTKNAHAMPYAEVRPMRSINTPYMHVPEWPTDCSESTDIILKASGAPMPEIDVKAGSGYTGTDLADLLHIPLRRTRRADLVVFADAGSPSGHHVVMLLQSGRWHRDPLVWSHGRPGVDVMPLSQMKRGFPGSVAVCLRSVPAGL
jgi:cell wall-associated NlpC family hydrolase